MPIVVSPRLDDKVGMAHGMSTLSIKKVEIK